MFVFQTTQQPSDGMIDYFETKSQPITKVMVLKAYQKVRANKGGAGVDRMTWAELDSNLKGHLYQLWNRLSSGSYFPGPVLQVEIPKKSGGVRSLGIPTLLDRIAQQVVREHLEKQLEPLFHESSFGYRPGRSAHDAVAQSQRNCFNHDFAIDLDIQSYFDTIDHELMIRALSHYCSDKWVLMYVSRWLKADIMKEGIRTKRERGTPQGGVISPLLSNLFLHVVFDGWMQRHHPEKPFERYADDMIVHCKTERQAQFLLARIRERMSSCGLTLHPSKTRIVNLRGKSERRYPRKYDFLGFTLRPVMREINGRWLLMPGTFVSGASKTSIRRKFKGMNIHKRRKPIAELARELNPVIEGIIQYFHKFWNGGMRPVWNQLNHRLLKWVKWEKGLFKYASLRWLRARYREQPNLFAHWKLVQP
jgi:group II intron reverse transcriptase/maturase